MGHRFCSLAAQEVISTIEFWMLEAGWMCMSLHSTTTTNAYTESMSARVLNAHHACSTRTDRTHVSDN